MPSSYDADYPLVPEYRHRLALGYTGRCETLCMLGRLKEARDGQSEGISILKSLVADFPSLAKYRQDLASGLNNLAIVLEDLDQRQEAEAAVRQAISVREKLVRDFPKVLDHVVFLGSNYSNLGGLIRDQGRADASLERYDKSVRVLEPALGRRNQLGYARQTLRNAYAGRAEGLDRLRRHEKAAEDWERAAALDDGQRRLFYQSRAALSRGDRVGAVSLAAKQAQAKGVSGSTLHDCARVCALAAAAVKENSPLEEKYASRAMSLLKQAVNAGYRNGPPLDPRSDPAFERLRGRTEFQQILKQLANAGAGGTAHK